MTTTPVAVATLLYDANCSLCSSQAARLGRLAQGRVAVAPLQGLTSQDERLSQDNLLRAVTLVTPEGAVYTGAEALIGVFIAGRPHFRFLARLYRLPGVYQLANATYAWVAARRYSLFGVSQQDTCDTGSCSLDHRTSRSEAK